MSDKSLVLLSDEIKTPPLSTNARVEAGFLLRKLQRGEHLELPHSRPMPVIGPSCHELRINDEANTWRIIYRIDADAIVIAHLFAKKTQTTLRNVITLCKGRYRRYDEDRKEIRP